MGTKQWTSITEFREFYDRQVEVERVSLPHKES